MPGFAAEPVTRNVPEMLPVAARPGAKLLMTPAGKALIWTLRLSCSPAVTPAGVHSSPVATR